MSADRPLPGPDSFAAMQADAQALDELAAGTTPASPAHGPADAAVEVLGALRAHIDLMTVRVAPGAVVRDALLLDRIAHGGTAPATDPAVRLLADLRAHIDGRGTDRSGVVDGTRLLPVAADELAARRRPALPRRAARVGLVAAGLTAAVLGTSGVAAAAYSSHPGATLYSLRAATFGRTDDDPVVDDQLVARITQQVAAAQATPAAAPAHLAAATAALQRLQRIAPLVRDPVLARNLAASTSTMRSSITTTRATVLSAPPTRGVLAAGGATVTTAPASSHASPGRGPLAGGRSGAAPTVTGAPGQPVTHPSPDPAAGAVAVPGDPAAGAAPYPAPSSVSPTEASTGSVPATPTQAPSETGTPTPPGPGSSDSPTASGTAAPSGSPSASGRPSPVASHPATTSSRTATPRSTPSAPAARTAKAKKKPVRRKVTTATLMTATVPASDASIRPGG